MADETTPELNGPFDIGVGSNFACALDALGTQCWGSENDFFQQRPPELVNPASIDVGDELVCALHDLGYKCWGRNDYGQSTVPSDLVIDPDLDGISSQSGLDSEPLTLTDTDGDGDGIFNYADEDDDNDSTIDENDAFPLDATESVDTDADGIGNNADTDDDNDGVSDVDEGTNGTDPLLGDTDGDGVADNLDEITVALSFDDRTFKVEITTAELADNPITATDFRFGPKGSSCFVELQSDKEAQSTSEKYVASRSWQVGSNFLSGQYGVINDTPRIFFEDGSVKYDQQQYFLTVSNPDYVEQEIALEKVVISKVQDAIGELRVEATISGVSNEGFLSAYPFSSDARYNFNVHLKNGATYHGDAPHPEDVTKISDGVFKVTTFHTVDNADDYANPKVQRIQVCDAAMHSKVWEQDADADGMIDVADAFPLDATETLDTDSDGTGNNADTDDDADGVADSADAFPLDAAETLDADSDGTGNNADTDDDGDGVLDTADAFALISLGSLTDTDGDGRPNDCDSACTTLGMAADTDDDNDGVFDTADAFPLDASESIDTDSDGTGNNADTDDDGDGVADGEDAFPLDAKETLDTDSDGIGNNADNDDDGDGVPDTADGYALISLGALLDIDSDGFPDNCGEDCLATGMTADSDDDNDGVEDTSDAFPLDATETADSDADGVGDNSDAFPDDATESLDSDSDSVGDNADNCSSLSNSDQLNTDGDTEGDACDSDDDNDGFSDEEEELDGTNPKSRFSCKSGCFSFDVDESLKAQPLTDGLLVIRHLFGFSGDSLTSGAVSGEASRGTSELISVYLTDAISELDIDGDGESKPLTDGLLLIRYLFGFSGDSLVSGAIGSGATRDT
ncbi:thrombospondin type 3 repeat-containing protein, partial [Pseudomonadales bacterium]|nr:thrombospondin type 3 repeat-containing protein [Pseudomonadales bacterium]